MSSSTDKIFRSARRSVRGNAMAELVILLPIYVLVILGLLYIGDLGGIRGLLHPTAEQSASRPGTVSALELQNRLFAAFPEGHLTVEESDLSEFPVAGRMREVMEYLVEPPSVPYASGSWRLENGRMVPVVTVGSHSRPSELRAQHTDRGQAEILEELLRGAMNVSETRATFQYDPGYIQPAGIGLSNQTLETTHRALVSGEAKRTVEGTGHGHPIDGILDMMPEPAPLVHYPEFMVYPRPLWEPDLGRTAR